MIISTDINYEELEKLHENQYDHEFTLPNFGDENFKCRFQILDEDTGRTITTGGIRLIPEIILVTDKDAPVLDRKIALYTALDYMINQAQQMGFTELHAFVQDSQWKQRLKRTGFHSPKGECLVINI